MLERLIERKKRIIVCLDEVDQLKNYDILYVLQGTIVTLPLFQNDYKALIGLDVRIKSRLNLVEIEFFCLQTRISYLTS